MTSAEAYKCLQDNCGLQVGDRVKITRKATDGEMGWPTIWLDDIFDELIGQTFTVTDFSVYGFLLDNKRGGSFPFFVLEKVLWEPRHGDLIRTSDGDMRLIILRNGELQALDEMGTVVAFSRKDIISSLEEIHKDMSHYTGIIGNVFEDAFYLIEKDKP